MEAATHQLHTDQSILQRLQQNDEQALELLFKTYYKPLLRFAKTIIKDASQAEDAVQDVFVKIWEKRNDLSITLSFKSYLYMAVRNHCFNTLKLNERKYWMDEGMENDEQLAVNNTEDNLIAKSLNHQIQQAIELLPDKCKLTFQLSRFENMSYKEIAETMNVSVKTVENQMGKALSVLRNQLSPYLQISIAIASLINCIL
ncbi:MAG: RNA polymerase sigma-70 factor [Bacteroidota bacterium]